MLKRYKILMVIIMLSLTGIIAVISIWLYGSYSYQLQVVVTDVERSLSNSIQSFYHQSNDNIKQKQRSYYRHIVGSDFIRILSNENKHIDSIRVQNIFDSLVEDRFSKRHKDVVNRNNSPHRFIVPYFILEQIIFDEKTIERIDSLLHLSLVDKGITFDVDVVLEKLQPHEVKQLKSKNTKDGLGMITTRPILVNGSEGEYLHARFEQPIYYVFGIMFWQIFIAFILIFGLVGTFCYLFWTINKQNKMALLRKSFVNNMTHELKTPVSTVTAGLEAIARYAKKGDVDKMNKYLSISQVELTYLTNMIEKVLQLDIDEVKGLSLDLERVNISSLIREVIELSRLISSKPIHINYEFEHEDIYLQVDKSHFKNVLSNLFDNAIKYSKDSVEISVGLRRTNRELFIHIEDQGVGIPQDYLKDIFDMFFRVPNGDIYSVKGFGLGLAYVKQVVEQHGGNISVKSEFGRGTLFIISIPINNIYD